MSYDKQEIIDHIRQDMEGKPYQLIDEPPTFEEFTQLINESAGAIIKYFIDSDRLTIRSTYYGKSKDVDIDKHCLAATYRNAIINNDFICLTLELPEWNHTQPTPQAPLY